MRALILVLAIGLSGCGPSLKCTKYVPSEYLDIVTGVVIPYARCVEYEVDQAR